MFWLCACALTGHRRFPKRICPRGNARLAQLFHNEIAVHFTAEEQTVFPVASEFRELAALVSDLVAEHVELRAAFAQVEAQTLSSGELCSLARTLSNHIRKEERQLFEMLQQLLSTEQLRGNWEETRSRAQGRDRCMCCTERSDAFATRQREFTTKNKGANRGTRLNSLSLRESVSIAEPSGRLPAHVTLEHCGVRLPEVDYNQAIQHVREFAIHIEAEQFATNLCVLA